ncbi:MAG: hypothetical protein HZB30_04710 [Nitrospirae bacterium]|nr:hypothetical protein [Nitrospirota bacterium]
MRIFEADMAFEHCACDEYLSKRARSEVRKSGSKKDFSAYALSRLRT